MNEFLAPFERMLADLCTPEQLREFERAAPTQHVWSAIADSGFLDALVSSEAGGFGLSLQDVQPLWAAIGRHAVTLPIGETMIARALIAQAGGQRPQGPIALAVAGPNGSLPVISALICDHILFERDGHYHIAALPKDRSGQGPLAETGVFSSLAGAVSYNALDAQSVGAAEGGGLRPWLAVLRASCIAGAAEYVTDITAAYANERVQFGKPIGRQQALQQNIATIAEQMVAARIACQLACSDGAAPSLERAALAKSIASRAATQIASVAHAVHGAIGISEEHDLQLYTRRLYEWRLADGSESYWDRLLGEHRLSVGSGSIDYIRSNLGAGLPA